MPTLTPAAVTAAQLLGAYDRLDYPTFGGTPGKPRPYDLNIFGIRADTQLRVTDRFDDVLGVLYRAPSGVWTVEAWPATTDPGLSGHLDPMNRAGVAILAQGYHRAMWKLGKHRGKYDALVQHAPVKVFRDDDRDRKLDTLSAPTAGVYGINGHRAGANAVAASVGDFSHGCQVLQHAHHLARLLQLCRQQAARGYGDTFSYALFLQKEVGL